jgi:hypothetical protein
MEEKPQSPLEIALKACAEAEMQALEEMERRKNITVKYLPSQARPKRRRSDFLPSYLRVVK